MKQNNLTNRVFLFLLILPCFVFAQSTITGKVGTNNGDPVSFANVIEKGTTNGTTTDIDGTYSIDVANLPVVLEFSSLGFTTVEQSVSSAGTVNVNMEESAESLEEVVVTGLATS
ncbi:MAG: carboxypeptidase-like regulatory domain-containing protein, partial [Flavobacteriaceae bacterium]|nr:carboxypeptidase-like regulatory domain-containing protein [Flavobacteriaceae bacterium]